MSTITLNGTPIESLGLVLTEASPLVAGFNRERQSIAWAGRTGVVSSAFATTSARVLRFATLARVTTVAARLALLDALSDALTGPVEVVFADGSERAVLGQCKVLDANVPSPSFVNLSPVVTVEIECANAARFDVEPSVVVLSATPVAVPVGTVTHGGLITVTGPNTTLFTVTYRAVSGVALGSLAITPVLLTGEYLVIDLDAEELVKVGTTGTETSAISWLGTSTWFTITPRDCARDMGAYATLESSVAASYTYRRNWEH